MNLIYYLIAGYSVAVAQEKSPKVYTSKYGYKTVLISAGTFVMGEGGQALDERPHEVHIEHDFFMGQTELTLGFWKKVMIGDPSTRYGTQCARVGIEDYPDGKSPVYCVGWSEAARMANQLSSWEGYESCYVFSGDVVVSSKGASCTGYRLPTEAEWEYAARIRPKRKDPTPEKNILLSKEKRTEAEEKRLKELEKEQKIYEKEKEQKNFVFSGSSDPVDIAWFIENSQSMPQMVGLQKSNAWGLYDMSGNVWEWCHDWYTPKINSETPSSGPAYGTQRVLRGGGFMSSRFDLRSVNRFYRYPQERSNQIGFRLVRTAPKKKASMSSESKKDK